MEEAVRWSEALINAGYSIDMGYAQINSQHIKPGGKFYKLGIGVADLFDPRINLLAGAKIYGDAHNLSNGDIVKALSIYNTGDSERGIKNGYVMAVLGQRN
jgi:type IV secretion system protein VirB1